MNSLTWLWKPASHNYSTLLGDKSSALSPQLSFDCKPERAFFNTRVGRAILGLPTVAPRTTLSAMAATSASQRVSSPSHQSTAGPLGTRAPARTTTALRGTRRPRGLIGSGGSSCACNAATVSDCSLRLVMTSVGRARFFSGALLASPMVVMMLPSGRAPDVGGVNSARARLLVWRRRSG